jgi:hypothetical protein
LILGIDSQERIIRVNIWHVNICFNIGINKPEMHVKIRLGLVPGKFYNLLRPPYRLTKEEGGGGVTGGAGAGGGKKVLGSQNFENTFLGSQYKKV